jgi:hypothetical protein
MTQDWKRRALRINLTTILSIAASFPTAYGWILETAKPPVSSALRVSVFTIVDEELEKIKSKETCNWLKYAEVSKDKQSHVYYHT